MATSGRKLHQCKAWPVSSLGCSVFMMWPGNSLLLLTPLREHRCFYADAVQQGKSTDMALLTLARNWSGFALMQVSTGSRQMSRPTSCALSFKAMRDKPTRDKGVSPSTGSAELLVLVMRIVEWSAEYLNAISGRCHDDIRRDVEINASQNVRKWPYFSWISFVFQFWEMPNHKSVEWM